MTVLSKYLYVTATVFLPYLGWRPVLCASGNLTARGIGFKCLMLRDYFQLSTPPRRRHLGLFDSFLQLTLETSRPSRGSKPKDFFSWAVNKKKKKENGKKSRNHDFKWAKSSLLYVLVIHAFR